MGAASRRKKETDYVDQRWEYISLNDFKARGCGPGFAYFWLWLMLIVSVAVYATDSFVAVNLLIMGQWSSKIEPPMFETTKWIFAGCILLSFVNLGYEAWRAFRVIKRGNVADSYLDPLAVRWESIRMGDGQGWKRFLVFAELTKSKKGAEYAALFTYFSLTAWIRVLLCSGPRQVINAFTFRAVYESKLLVSEATVEGSLSGFFEKIAAMYEKDNQEALILGAMAFTFVVWVFSFIFLIVAVLIYVTFLCHWIPKSDGGLRGYCERKVNQTLTKIVTQKVNRALAKGDAERMKAQFKASKGGEIPQMERMATLPTLPNIAPGPPATKVGDDSLPSMPVLGRNETTTTLPMYSSRPPSPGSIEMGAMGRMLPQRTATMASAATDRTYSSKASLLGTAADMGSSGPASPPYSQYPQSRDYYGGPPPGRQFNGYDNDGRGSPAPSSINPRATPGPRFNNGYADGRAGSPAPSSHGYPPSRSATGPPPHRGPYPPPQRNMTGPMPPRGPPQYPQGYDRPGTSQSHRGPYGYGPGPQGNNGYGGF